MNMLIKQNGERCTSEHIESVTVDLSKFDFGLEQGGISLNKPKTIYFEKEDILHLVISDEPESDSIELSPNITAELNENGELIGIEILNASTFIQDIACRLS